jgi:hypothetical protein
MTSTPLTQTKGRQEIILPSAGGNENFTYDENSDVRTLTPSEQLSAAIHYLYEQLDERLFKPYLRDKHGDLLGGAPDVIITVQSTGRVKGFAAKAIWSDHRGSYLDQITLVFKNHGHGDVKDLASTLAHEAMHAKQFHDGKPGGGNYHNRQFSDWMKSIGLQTSQTGKPGGRDIGVGMSDYIIQGGPFDRVMDELIAEGFSIPWETVDAIRVSAGDGDPPKPRDLSKVKFTCPQCGQNAWAKRSAKLLCGISACAAAPMITQVE